MCVCQTEGDKERLHPKVKKAKVSGVDREQVRRRKVTEPWIACSCLDDYSVAVLH